MTRQDFELIAGVLSEAAIEAGLEESPTARRVRREEIARIAADFAVRLKATNPRFDTDRFLKAALNEGLLK